MNSLAEIAGVLRKAGKVILCGHVMPDGDCVGAVAALGMALETLGKQVFWASPDPLPEMLSFVPGFSRFLIGEESLRGEYDTFVIVDCSVPERLDKVRALLERDIVTINIDHHVSTGHFARYNYIDPTAAAAGEIVLDLIDLLGVEISRDIAICLYVALVTDTGSFQYENTSPATLRRAARLLDTGIPSSAINIWLYEEKPLVTLKVLGEALTTLQVSPCGKVAWITVDKNMLNKLVARDEHTDGLINFVRTIKGVEVAIFFREVAPGRYKVGFRSKGAVDVNLLAAKFGGGGHARAAGCVLEGDFEDIKNSVLAVAVSDAAG